ncbi:MAG: 30S ribosomal protein S19 [Candidatus Aenigmarchaeota archaeon]|nr:30S ribosomal protein S19 [Candidatus Aenigmarchaeota archaeon]
MIMVKVFKFRGKSLEEIKKLSLEEYSKILTSRERRAILRGLTDRQKKLLEQIRKDPQKFHKTHERDMVILPEMVDIKLGIYNGKEYVSIVVTPEMLGHRLGEFVMTRQRVMHSAPGAGATHGSKHIPLK